MIVPMKKVTLVTLERHREATLRELRRAGVMHVHLDPAAGAGDPSLEQLREQRSAVERALGLLATEEVSSRAPVAVEDPVALARSLISDFEREQALFERTGQLARLASQLEPWGDFSPADIEALASRGIRIRLVTMSRAELGRLAPDPGREAAVVLAAERGMVHVAWVSLGGAGSSLPGSELSMPEMSLSAVRAELARLQHEQAELRARRRAMAGAAERLQAELQALDHRITFERVRVSMGTEGPLAYLVGFVPFDAVARLEERAEASGWALLVEDPAEDDPVPTLVRNPAWVRIVQPLFDFLGITPGYGEHDISLWFLLFYTVFWAMIIGDAGYGLLYMGVAAWLRSRMKRARPEFFRMVYAMSAATIVWGAVTGTWFGSRTLAQWPPLAALTVQAIASFPRSGANTNANIMALCFAIGAVHLSLAHLLAFAKKRGSLSALAELGWLGVVWGMYCLVQVMVLGKPAGSPLAAGGPLSSVSLMQAAQALIAGGLALVVLFAEQKGGLLKGLALGLAWLPMRLMNAISSFADTVSYVRLFAVGLAGVKVAGVFNDMAAAVAPHAFPVSVLILVLGHGLNIVLGSMALLVHGVRLNVLEFSTHLGMEWRGIAYAPFAEPAAPESA